GTFSESGAVRLKVPASLASQAAAASGLSRPDGATFGLSSPPMAKSEQPPLANGSLAVLSFLNSDTGEALRPLPPGVRLPPACAGISILIVPSGQPRRSFSAWEP